MVGDGDAGRTNDAVGGGSDLDFVLRTILDGRPWSEDLLRRLE